MRGGDDEVRELRGISAHDIMFMVRRDTENLAQFTDEHCQDCGKHLDWCECVCGDCGEDDEYCVCPK